MKQIFSFKKKEKGTEKKPVKKLVLGAVLLAVIAGGAVFVYQKKAASLSKKETSVRTGTVTRQTIQQSLSSSGTISPKNSYTITSMVEGKVISADFNEGDQVTEGQVLYQIDASSMTSKLNSATNSLERAQESYNDAMKDYNSAVADYSGNTVKSTVSGYIKTLKIRAGDQVSGSTEIAEIYNDSVMEVDIPFLSVEAAQIPVGSTATLTISDTLEEISGTVTSVDQLDTTLTGGQLVRYVTVQVTNPGGLTSDMYATASINGINSCGDGAFQPIQNVTLRAGDLSGSVTVKKLLVSAGDYVNVGTAIFSMDAEDASDILKTYKNKVDDAKSSLENAQSTLDTTTDNYENYTITAPISGTVMTKNVNAGENVQNGNSTTTLAVIYDLSEVTFEMNIDELDISNVKVGQKVEVTADAFEDQTFEGTVTKVSMEGTAASGVTYYPVTVTMTEYDGLLPGMNVTGVIILDEAEDALAIPVDALQRGNKVYVKDSTTSKKAEASTQGVAAAGDDKPEGTADDKSEGNATGQKPTNKGTDENGKSDDKNAKNSTVPEGFHEVTVTTGLTSDEYVEILSGDLSEGDEVYISQSSVSSSTDMMMPGMGGGDMGGGMGGGNPGGGGNMGGGMGGGNPGGGGNMGGGMGGGPGGGGPMG